MAGRVKIYGPAADADPRELLLAKLIQNGKARGLKWTHGTEFRGANGRAIEISDFEDVSAKEPHIVSCCAAGAARLEPDTVDALGGLIRVELGNDASDSDAWGSVSDYNGVMLTEVPSTDGEDIGYAFRKAFR